MNIKLVLVAIGTLVSILTALLAGLGVATHHMLVCSPADGLCNATVAAWQGKESWLIASMAMAAVGVAWLFSAKAKSQNATCKSGMI